MILMRYSGNYFINPTYFFNSVYLMGVTDLNKIIKTATPVKHDDYTYVLVDMSNMLVTYLFRWYARFPTTKEINFKNYDVTMNKGALIVENIEDLMTSLRSYVMGDVTKAVRDLLELYPKLKSIIFVSDPYSVYKYRYMYNSEKHMHCVDNDLFNEWITLNGHEITDYEDISIDFSSKEAEKAIRVKSQMVEQPITITDKQGNVVKVIEDYLDLKEEPEDEELKHIYHVLYTCTYFMKRSRLMKLMMYIQDAVINYAEINEKVEYFCSKGEADIFIKAYQNSHCCGDDDRTLVLSNDTDYFMLFADTPSADTSRLEHSEIYNPNQFWSELLGIKYTDSRFMMLTIARLSALFGNDYTCHHRKIVAEPKNIDAIRCLFNIDEYKDIDVQYFHPSSSIAKFRTLVNSVYEDVNEDVQELYKKYEAKPTDARYRTYKYNRAFKHIDTAIVLEATKTTNHDFFNGYYETLLIYMNFKTYGDYIDMKGQVLSTELQKQIKDDVKYRIDFENNCKEIDA